ncbi:uncharacterized protein [Haliotis cracherodii]|uniref:uncharacterized protein n=1 Tax=Haliotis cracherodii TaxID=6455 RepID=UPI0039E8F345
MASAWVTAFICFVALGVDRSTSSLETGLYFKAYLSQSRRFGMGSTVIFDKVEGTNGHGYNPTSGVFRAPVSGTYLFAFNIEIFEDGWSDFAIFNEGKVESRMAVRNRGTCSMVVTTSVRRGSHVRVGKIWDKGKNSPIRHDMFTVFSGHLVHANKQ